MEVGTADLCTAEYIRLVADTIPAWVRSMRPDRFAELVNQRWLEYTGLSAEQALDWGGGKAAIDPDDLPSHVGNLLRTARDLIFRNYPSALQ